MAGNLAAQLQALLDVVARQPGGVTMADVLRDLPDAPNKRTVQRWLRLLREAGRVDAIGGGYDTRYILAPVAPPAAPPGLSTLNLQLSTAAAAAQHPTAGVPPDDRLFDLVLGNVMISPKDRATTTRLAQALAQSLGMPPEQRRACVAQTAARLDALTPEQADHYGFDAEQYALWRARYTASPDDSYTSHLPADTAASAAAAVPSPAVPPQSTAVSPPPSDTAAPPAFFTSAPNGGSPRQRREAAPAVRPQSSAVSTPPSDTAAPPAFFTSVPNGGSPRQRREAAPAVCPQSSAITPPPIAPSPSVVSPPSSISPPASAPSTLHSHLSTAAATRPPDLSTFNSQLSTASDRVAPATRAEAFITRAIDTGRQLAKPARAAISAGWGAALSLSADAIGAQGPTWMVAAPLAAIPSLVFLARDRLARNESLDAPSITAALTAGGGALLAGKTLAAMARSAFLG